jgi:hypothetical protein
MLKCKSSLFAACGGGYLGSGGINMNCQFFRRPGAGAIRIVQWSFCSSCSKDRRSNTLPSALHQGSSVDGFKIAIGQHAPVLMMLMNLVDVWWFFNMVTVDKEGEGTFFMNECT